MFCAFLHFGHISAISSLAQAASFPWKNTVDQPRFPAYIPSNRWYIPRIFQIWSTPTGYEELAGEFEPIGNSEIF